MRLAPLPLSNIDVAILVGGLGTRLRGVVDGVPKPLAPVLGRPFLYYLLDMLALRGARSVTLCSGYMAGFVKEKTGTEWLGMPIHHSAENEPMGTAGALALARNYLRSERVLVLNGDTWLEPDFKAFAASAEKSDFCIAGATVPDASRYGMLEWDASGRLIAFTEKNQSGTSGSINAGMYLITQNLLASLTVEPLSLERQVLPGLTIEGRVKVFRTDSPFLDIGIPEDYAAAGNFFSALGIAPHTMFPDMPPMELAQPKLGTCAVIFDESGRILLEQRSDCGWWCLPAGRLDAGETLAQGAVRETREETGLDIEITGFLGMFSDPRRRTVCYPDNGDLRQLVDAAVTARPTGGQLAPSPESLDLRWFAPNELPLNTAPPVVEILRVAFRHECIPVLR
ncbi:MAG: sugar phosphate nucleotidyltransferase [Verrucomicrobia bacterium]|nr:sugar phosphate nucleotidyltransferase [Verrucomicrobiota bacterium]